MIAIQDFWVWDSWYAWSGETLHAFYLKAPKSLQDPTLRHHSARVGHSTSQDGATWTHHPDALGPSETDAFDDLAIWTGSVIWHEGVWHMFYTGIDCRSRGRIQRIGHATSTDLYSWSRVGNTPILTAEAPAYATAKTDLRSEEPFRDPWVFWYEGQWHMLVTARAGGAQTTRGSGNMAHAVSSDLNSWTLLEPLISESGFDQLEVFQVLQVQQKWFVFFCSQPGDVHRPGVEKRHATYVAPAAGPLGPFDLDRARPIPTAGGYYAGRVVEFLDGSLKLFGFIDDGSLEGFQGEIGDPLPLSLSEQGELVFDVEQASAGGNRGSRLYADVSHRS